MNASLARPPVAATNRPILWRTRGRTQGPITRLVSPEDAGAVLKPFVFLDYIQIQGGRGPGFGWHPHSGIATLTFMIEGDMRYADSTGQAGVLVAGGLEWMSAGGGVWHTGGPARPDQPVNAKGFQLWIALRAELELSPPRSQYIDPAAVPATGPVRVLLGAYDGATSPIAAPDGLTYLAVTLEAGERWRFTPPKNQEVAWIAVFDGAVLAPTSVAEGELAIFAEGSGALEFEAPLGAGFILGTATRHPHDLHLGYSSVHTGQEALARGEAGIAKLGERLRRDGVLRA